jgi:hypothetical protein
MAGDWKSYIDAAHRKVDIATFHFDQLCSALHQDPTDHAPHPGIPVQAFFEGVITAVISAADQVAQAANSALKLRAGHDGRSLFDVASPEIESRVPSFKHWKDQSIGVDLRRLRTRMVHYSYEKSPNTDRNWYVESTDSGYTGSRDLLSYASSAVTYAKELALLANQLQDSLSSCQPTAS